MSRIAISHDVSEALRAGLPVVALESAVITTGLPPAPLDRTPKCELPGWQLDQPTNLQAALVMERLVRAGGAVPATVAVIEGELKVGLDASQLERLAGETTGLKVTSSGLARTMASGITAGTTVSATLVACGRVGPIRVFATGGIGGVHRNWRDLPDVSGDLEQLSRTQTCVISAGAKSILDLPATLQRLETLNVPVVGFGTDHFPRFHCLGSDDLPVPHRCDEPGEIARLCRIHWRTLGLPGGVLVANPIPAEYALDPEELEQAIDAAEGTAQDQGITSAALTPFLLAELSRLTSGHTLDANLALLAHNASLAARIAGEMAADRKHPTVR